MTATPKLKITRVGGMLPTLRPAVTHDVDRFDEPTHEALLAFVEQAGRVRSALHPGAMNYVFELEQPGAGARKVSCGFSDIPEALRGLLPR